MDNDLGQQILTEMRTGFARVDSRIDNVLTEMRSGFGRLDGRIDDLSEQVFTEMHSGFGRLDNRIDSLRDESKSDISGLRSEMSRLRSEMSRLRSEMNAGFAKQEKLSHDIIQTTMQYVNALAGDHEKRIDLLATDVADIKNQLGSLRNN